MQETQLHDAMHKAWLAVMKPRRDAPPPILCDGNGAKYGVQKVANHGFWVYRASPGSPRLVSPLLATRGDADGYLAWLRALRTAATPAELEFRCLESWFCASALVGGRIAMDGIRSWGLKVDLPFNRCSMAGDAEAVSELVGKLYGKDRYKGALAAFFNALEKGKVKLANGLPLAAPVTYSSKGVDFHAAKRGGYIYFTARATPGAERS